MRFGSMERPVNFHAPEQQEDMLVGKANVDTTLVSEQDLPRIGVSPNAHQKTGLKFAREWLAIQLLSMLIPRVLLSIEQFSTMKCPCGECCSEAMSLTAH